MRSLRGQRKFSHLVDDEGTGRLTQLAREAGASHLAYISIVGVDRAEYFYYRNKLAAETYVCESGIPWTTLRATQFHSLVDLALAILARWPGVTPPAGWRRQRVGSSSQSRPSR